MGGTSTQSIDDLAGTLRPGARLFTPGAPPEKSFVSLAKPVTLIGSGSGVHVSLRTRTVEEFHVLILNIDGHVYLRDMGTLEGVQVNGQQVRETCLRDQDRIQVGRALFVFEAGPDVDPVSAPVPPIEWVRNVAPAELWIADRSHPLQGRVVLIGRGPRCDFKVDDERIFDKHAVLYWGEGNWHLRILTPGPGTLLNERTIRRAKLHDGDILLMGTTEIRFRLGHSKQPVAQDIPPAIVEQPQVQPTKVEAEAEAEKAIPTDALFEKIPAVEAPPPPLERPLPEVKLRAAARDRSVSAIVPPKGPKKSPVQRKTPEAVPLEKPLPGLPPAPAGGAEFIRAWGPVAAAMASTHELEPEPEEAEQTEPGRRRSWLVAIIGALILLAGLLWGIVWWLSK